LFPGSLHQGAQAEVYDRNFVSSNIGSSYRCQSGILVDLGEVVISIENLWLQAFFDKPPMHPFDEENVCTADKQALSALEPIIDIRIPIIIISFFAFFVIICCIAFVIIKLKKQDYSSIK
jgi:hypothetical protein